MNPKEKKVGKPRNASDWLKHDILTLNHKFIECLHLTSYL